MSRGPKRPRRPRRARPEDRKIASTLRRDMERRERKHQHGRLGALEVNR